jgi:two-component system, cell cycle sensor histidine kinase and response regulator CckA
VPGHVGRSVFDTCRDFPDIIAMAKEMMKGREGITTYHFNRIRGNTADKVLKHAVYLPIPIGNTFWSVVVATPEEEVMTSLTGFRLKLLMITLSLLFFCIVSTYLLVKSQVIIREQKKREEIVKALQESEESFRRLFDGSSDAILLLKEGHFVECNHAALTMLGNITRESFINSRPEDISPLYQPDGRLSADAAKERIESAYKEGHHRFEWVHLKADGTEFYTDVALTTIAIKGERMLHVTWRDITERKRADEEKERLQIRLLQAQKMESVGRLAGGVAHDFNNILQAILGYAEIALMKVDPKGPIYNNLQEIIKAGRRSADLTRQLLAFARKQVAIPKVLDLNNTVTGMLKMLQRLIGEDIDLAWIPGHDLWSVKMDPSQIDQIMANLVVNSRDAVAPGTGQVTIKTANTQLDKTFCSDHPECIPGEYVMLSVSDNGCGMDQETLANIFEPFFTTKGVGEGTGLGLATVYGIVKQNEGLITIDSDPKKGTTFTIYLPRFVSESTQAQVERDEHTPRKGTETVLMVEDNDAVLDLGRIILEQLGYKVLIAHKPADAISISEEYTGPIHLLITDVVMPEMNGRELAKRLVSMRQDMKCLYMSGYTADIIALHGVLNEGIYFIQKPFSINVLADKVRQVLET